MIDGGVEGGLVGRGRDSHYDDGFETPEEIYDFETASSAFYTQLAAWYNEVNQEWLDRVTKELEEAERVEEEQRKRHEELNSEETEERIGKKRLRERYERTQRKN